MRYALLFLLALFLVFGSFSARKPNVDSWKLCYNDSILVSGGGPKMDNVIILHSRNFHPTDSLKFYYHPCAGPRGENSTPVYLAFGQKQVLVSEKEPIGFYLFGSFAASRLKEIFDSCDCPFLELQYLMRDRELRSMVKLKVLE